MEHNINSAETGEQRAEQAEDANVKSAMFSAIKVTLAIAACAALAQIGKELQRYAEAMGTQLTALKPDEPEKGLHGSAENGTAEGDDPEERAEPGDAGAPGSLAGGRYGEHAK